MCYFKKSTSLIFVFKYQHTKFFKLQQINSFLLCRDGSGNVQCRLIYAEHSTANNNKVYGGKDGYGSLGCGEGFYARGLDCYLPISGPAVNFAASEECLNNGAALLTPHDLTQNEIIKSMMIDEVRFDLDFS